VANVGHPPPNLHYADWPSAVSALARSIRSVLRGETNNVGSFTLGSGSTTTVTDTRAHINSVITFSPTNAAAAGTAIYVSTKNDGSFVVTHAPDPDAGTFDYALSG